jgi:hypothetical protein
MRWAIYITAGLVITLLVLMVSYFPLRSPLTGFVVDIEHGEGVKQRNVDAVSWVLYDLDRVEWTPAQECPPKECILEGIRVSGTLYVNSSGINKLFVEFDGDSFLLIENEEHLPVQSFKEEISIEDHVNSTIKISPQENSTSQLANLSTSLSNENGSDSLESVPALSADTDIKEERVYEIEEPITVFFNEICDANCVLDPFISRNTIAFRGQLTPGSYFNLSRVSYILARPIAEDNTTVSINITYANETNQSVLNQTLLSPENASGALGFEARDNAPYPLEWFLKQTTSARNEDSARWEWEPLSDGSLRLNLQSMSIPQDEYNTPNLRMYSRQVVPVVNASTQFSFTMVPDFSGECLEVGVEIGDYSGNSRTSFAGIINERGIGQSSDLIISARDAGQARQVSVSVPWRANEGELFSYYFGSTCSSGSVLVSNFSYTFIN